MTAHSFANDGSLDRRILLSATMTASRTTLRILATTDLHMNLSGFDYIHDRAGRDSGLNGLILQIAGLRAERPDAPCLLVDNGDFLQGGPLADWLADQKITQDHPLVRTFNTLGYDAVGLGNHDLDYPSSYLTKIISALDAPVISSNLTGAGIGGLVHETIVTRMVPLRGGAVPLRIAVLSALPPETALWNRSTLQSGAAIEDPVSCFQGRAAALRREGADIVVVLAHLGVGEEGTGKGMADTGASKLARLPGIDAIIAGHTHQRHPDPDAATPSAAVPIVMPGSYGSHLGLIDLDLRHTADTGWQVEHHHARLYPPVPTAPQPNPEIIRVHDRARAALAETVAELDRPLHTHFGLVQPGPVMALTARAKALAIRKLLEGTRYAQLPLLAAAAARHPQAGAIDIPAGRLARRQLSAFVPFKNNSCALLLNGAQVKAWLERAAAVYTTATLEDAAPLLRQDVPLFQFDAIYGLSYVIDLRRQVGRRINDLTCEGKPLAEDDRVVLATNSFRAAGGGGYDGLDLPSPLGVSAASLGDCIAQVLRDDERPEWDTAKPWKLRAPGCKAVLPTSPGAMRYIDEIAAFAPRIIDGPAPDRVTIEISL